MASKKSRVDELLEQQKTITNEALRSAMEKHIEEERHKEEAFLLDKFRQITGALNKEVEKLRGIREQEKAQERKVKMIDLAFTKFKEDGNWDEFYARFISL